MLATYFDQHLGAQLMGRIEHNKSCIALEVSDGSRSNFTKRIGIMVNLEKNTVSLDESKNGPISIEIGESYVWIWREKIEEKRGINGS